MKKYIIIFVAAAIAAIVAGAFAIWGIVWRLWVMPTWLRAIVLGGASVWLLCWAARQVLASSDPVEFSIDYDENSWTDWRD